MPVTQPIVYPDDLPTPQAAPFRPDERRFLSSGRPFQARPMQLDRLAMQEIIFPPMPIAQATQIRDWWRDQLAYGGNWFSAPKWARPQGIGGVRKWLGTLRMENVANKYVRISGVCEVRGLGMPPLKYFEPLLAMHFSGNFTDESGHSIAPWHWFVGDTPPTIQITDPKFTGYMFGAYDSLLQPLISDVRGSLNLNEFGEWQSRFWVKLNDVSLYTGKAGGMVWTLQGASQLGGSIPGTPGGDAFQISVRVDRVGGETAGFASLRVSYNGVDRVDPSVNASSALAPVATDSELVPIDDDWHFIVVCGDATSTRAYIDTNLALDDTSSPFPAGSSPLWYSAASSFENQVFIVAAAFNGGISDDGWPSTAVFGSYFTGGLDDLEITNGPGSVEFTGSTIVVPNVPF